MMFTIGALFNIFAPGNFNRMDQVDSSFSWSFLDNYKLNQKPIKATLISMIIVFGMTKKFLLRILGWQ